MKKLILSFVFLMATVFTIAQTPKFDWAKKWGGAYDDLGISVAVDANGNVYTTGSFSDSVDFDPSAARATLKSSGVSDIFISKIDGTGKLVWAKKIGGATVDAGYAITTDASGNIFITGGFTGAVDFDPGTAVKTLTASGSSGLMDIFVAKFDASGNLTWAKSIGANLTDYGSSIAVDASGNVYTTGFFYSTVDFDPDATTVNLSSKGNSDIFILKLDATGKFVWAKSIGSSSADAGRCIALNASYVYITGTFSGTADFDPGLVEQLLTSTGGTDIFALQLDKDGNYQWAKNMGGTLDEEGTSITVSASGLSYITGRFSGTADFNPGTGKTELTSAGDKDIFILKLDNSGNLSWAKRIGGLSTDLGLSIAIDASGEIYTTGSFKGTVDFDPGANKSELTSLGLEDIFISKLDVLGNFLWAKKIGETLSDAGQCIFVSKTTGAIYLTGFFTGTVDFDPDAPKLELTSSGITDVFVEKINASSGSIENLTKNEIRIYPNPTTGIINLDLGNRNLGEIKIQILNSLGQIVLEQNSEVQQSNFSIQHLPKGLYLVGIIHENRLIQSRKIVKL
ncbi:MAG: T9SS type A sorting domain-containing protein [Bacteroidia bacterium]